MYFFSLISFYKGKSNLVSLQFNSNNINYKLQILLKHNKAKQH